MNPSCATQTANHPIADVTLSDAERQPCEVWTRVMGYHRPLASFNIGKKGEYAQRKHFTEAAAHTCR